MLNTHRHAYMYTQTHSPPFLSMCCLKTPSFCVRTSEDMNQCVIGLGSSNGPNMHDGSKFCGQKRLCAFRAQLKTLPLPKEKKNTQESQSLEFFCVGINNYLLLLRFSRISCLLGWQRQCHFGRDIM